MCVHVVQIAAKEHELQMALQKQEKYQQAVQDLNAKMERAQIYLTRTPATSAADINMQMKEYRVSTERDLENISIIQIVRNFSHALVSNNRR